MQGRRHEFEGGEGSMYWKVGVNTVKPLKFEKDVGCITPPPFLWWRRPFLNGSTIPNNSSSLIIVQYSIVMTTF